MSVGFKFVPVGVKYEVWYRPDKGRTWTIEGLMTPAEALRFVDRKLDEVKPPAVPLGDFIAQIEGRN